MSVPVNADVEIPGGMQEMQRDAGGGVARRCTTRQQGRSNPVLIVYRDVSIYNCDKSVPAGVEYSFSHAMDTFCKSRVACSFR